MKEIIGDVVRALRKEAKLSQEALVQRSGVTKNYLSEVERGLKLPSYITLRKLAYGLRLPLWDLVQKIELRAYALSDFPNASIRSPGRERVGRRAAGPGEKWPGEKGAGEKGVDEKWEEKFAAIDQEGRVQRLRGLSEVLEENRELLQNTSAEEFLEMMLAKKQV
ncbi:helix-turn-helix transcriptional regulator [Candidatus Haliotispira prima]|uniref:Helix-turn-helix transcriptional regulator n=1 Tax=Candidatus Haliotispira prima TaxID=3034016 RepID=A0ABY8MEX7_9SPIO|nr:helix-turn-helix transcriptional regulator [Candidatus Haliotispira prima]